VTRVTRYDPELNMVLTVELTVADSECTVLLPIYGNRPPFGCMYSQTEVYFLIRQLKH